MRAKKVYAITTKTFDENGGIHGGGAVGIYSSKKKACEALNKWKRELVKNCGANVTCEGKNYFRYNYGNKTSYQYEIYWYELNDETMLQYGHCSN